MESVSSPTTPQKQTLIVNVRLNVAPDAPLHRVLVSNGRISSIEVDNGDHLDGSEFATVIDADGATLFPGMQGNDSLFLYLPLHFWTCYNRDFLTLKDAHIHVAMLGESLHYVNLIDCYSIDAMKEMIEKKLNDEPHLPFVVGFNWDQTKLGRLPSRFDIDSVCSKPVRLLSRSYKFPTNSSPLSTSVCHHSGLSVACLLAHRCSQLIGPGIDWTFAIKTYIRDCVRSSDRTARLSFTWWCGRL